MLRQQWVVTLDGIRKIQSERSLQKAHFEMEQRTKPEKVIDFALYTGQGEPLMVFKQERE